MDADDTVGADTDAAADGTVVTGGTDGVVAVHGADSTTVTNGTVGSNGTGGADAIDRTIGGADGADGDVRIVDIGMVYAMVHVVPMLLRSHCAELAANAIAVGDAADAKCFADYDATGGADGAMGSIDVICADRLAVPMLPLLMLVLAGAFGAASGAHTVLTVMLVVVIAMSIGAIAAIDAHTHGVVGFCS